MRNLITILCLLTTVICLPIHAHSKQTLSVSLEQAMEYVIDNNIVNLLTLSIKQPKKANARLIHYPSRFANLNIGEQYLVLLSKANIAQHNKQHYQVIALIEQAKLLEKNIAAKQLASPAFASLYQVLATSLAATENYEKAYQVQKLFIDNYNDYGDAQRDRIVRQLTKKHEITHKVELNKLLDNQNKLKALRLNEVEKKQDVQQRNFILILCTIAIFILLFLRQLKVRKKLMLLTRTDSLTGLTNRAALFVKGQELIDTSVKAQLELSVILFNIDDFKRINDNFGRHVGDLVLAKVAQLVSETMRSRDIFARLNGEEFVAILPSTDIGKAKAIAMRVIEKIATYDFSHLGLDSNIALNIGVANNDNTSATFDALLHTADLAMSQARSQGKNQMISYNLIVKDQEKHNSNLHSESIR